MEKDYMLNKMKITCFIFICITVILSSCNYKNNKSKCDDDVIISKANYNYFINNIKCYRKQKYIVIMRVGEDTLTDILNKLSNSDSIINISISNVKTVSVPNVLYRFVRLKELEFTSCGLEFIGKGINNLSNLTSINLSDNNLKEIPFINDKLEKIDISSNNLRDIPEFIIELKQLKYINIKNNKITNFPVDIVKWDSIKTINIFNNNFDSLVINKVISKFGESKVVNSIGLVE